MFGLWPAEVDRMSLAQILSVMNGRRKLSLAQAGKSEEDDLPSGAELDAALELLDAR